MSNINTIWDLSDEQLNAIQPGHRYLGASQFDENYNPLQRSFALILADEKTPVFYQWDGDFNATSNALKSAGVAFRDVCAVCWVDDFDAAKKAVENMPETQEEKATLVKIDL